MKKIIALVLCLVMVFALCACGESNTATTAPAADTATEAPAEEPAAAGSVYYLNFKPEADEAWQALAAAYTKQTGVPVTVVTAASGTYDQTLTSRNGQERSSHHVPGRQPRRCRYLGRVLL